MSSILSNRIVGFTLIVSETTAPPKIRVATIKLDKLVKFIKLNTYFYADKASWYEIFHARKGQSNFSKHLACLIHKAAPLLSRFENVVFQFYSTPSHGS